MTAGLPDAPTERPDSLEGRTAWARNLAAPVRSFLGTETAGGAAMLVAVAAALIWANGPWRHSYESVWQTRLSITLGAGGIGLDLRHWVNEGLMTLLFLVVGLEAKRELDLGELRERRRLAVPVVAALGGAALPALIFTAANAGTPSAHAWGAAISTDTAIALGATALLTPRSATRLRVFLLTLAVVDDLIALAVIGTVYTTHIEPLALAAALALLGVLGALRYAPVARAPLSVIAATGLWVALERSGVDPVIAGLAIGLATSAYPPSREDLERVTHLARSFREQPTAELARSALVSVRSAVSPNERLQYDLHPWTSYVVVPLFALANAGVHITGGLLSRAAGSAVTLGIAGGYLLGKPLGIVGAAWLATRERLRGPRPPISLPSTVTAGAFAGAGFTVSLLVAGIALSGRSLEEAKIGVLATVILAPVLGALSTRIYRSLPAGLLARQLSGVADDLLDLSDDVEDGIDHVRGPAAASVTLIEFGDFECTYCGYAEPAIRELLSSFGDEVRYVWRHLPLSDVHPSAQAAAEAAEAAAAQDRFWDMYERLIEAGAHLAPRDLLGHARALGLDVERFADELRRRAHAPRVARDVASADRSGVSGTPTFFINGRRHYGAYDIDSLSEAVRTAQRRARLAGPPERVAAA